MSLRFPSVLLLACALFAPAFSPAQSKADFDKLEKVLEHGKARFLATLEKVKDEQWDPRPSEKNHSIGQEAEHIALSENDLQQVIKLAMKSPEQPAAPERLKGKVATIEEVLLGEDAAAEGYQPPEKLVNRAEVLEFFVAANRKLMALLESSRGQPLAAHVFVHPDKKLGELNAMQWFYYIAHHRERHIRQIEALLANPNMPGAVQSARLR